MIAINAQPGLTGSVNVILQGVPQGVSALPSSSFSLTAGASQAITFSVADSATVGSSSITAIATNDSHSHQTQITLTADAIVRTYQSGSVLYLESGTATDTSRIGLETNWGGSIVEVSLNGTNFVNEHDTGREVQPSYRDGNNLNYNPTLGGDMFDQGTPTISYVASTDSLFTTAQPLQWDPTSYGGGEGRSVAGDILVEQTVTAVTSQPHTFKVHLKATHLNNDQHANTGQEFPAVYTNRDYNRFVYYGGNAPWKNNTTTSTQLPNLGQPNPAYYVSEQWGSLVNTQNSGLTVYVPSVDPYFIGFTAPDIGGGGPADNSTNYFAPLGNLTIGPGFVFEGDFYVIAGDGTQARQIVYQLHQNLMIPDIFAPFENIDQPPAGSKVSGVTLVSGWAFDDVKVSKVQILIDRVVDGTANYGLPRPDVQQTFPSAPVNVGFSYSLDTTKYTNGTHTLNVQAIDSSGNIALTPDEQIVISN
jgi:Bacterial Ig domain